MFISAITAWGNPWSSYYLCFVLLSSIPDKRKLSHLTLVFVGFTTEVGARFYGRFNNDLFLLMKKAYMIMILSSSCNDMHIWIISMFFFLPSWSISKWKFCAWTSEWGTKYTSCNGESSNGHGANVRCWCCSLSCCWSHHKFKYRNGLLGCSNFISYSWNAREGSFHSCCRRNRYWITGQCSVTALATG